MELSPPQKKALKLLMDFTLSHPDYSNEFRQTDGWTNSAQLTGNNKLTNSLISLRKKGLAIKNKHCAVYRAVI